MKHFAAVLLGLLILLPADALADRLVLVAGGGDEAEDVPATRAKLNSPFGVDFDKAGNMFICELEGERLLRVDAKGILKIIGGTGKTGNSGDGGPARQATFNGMHNLAISPTTGDVYLADTWNNRIRKYDPRTGTITAFAGTGMKGYAGDGGPAADADFGGIYCLCFNADGSKLYACDLDNRRIRVIDMRSGRVELAAGNGEKGVPVDRAAAVKSPLVDPRAVAVDRQGRLYVLERSGNALRVVGPRGKIRTVVGSGEAGLHLDPEPLRCQLNGPKHLCIDLDDNVIIADTANHRILKYSPAANTVTLLAGTGQKGESGAGGPPLEVAFNEPHGVFVTPAGVLYIVDSRNHRVFRWESEAVN